MKVSNAYAEQLPRNIYDATPKAVFAAIAVSLATHGDPFNADPLLPILKEWEILHQNGIVPQPITPFRVKLQEGHTNV
jgi:hypothetical protein